MAEASGLADDITPLQQMTPQVREQDAVLFDIRPAVAWLNDRQAGQQVAGQKVFIGENPPRGRRDQLLPQERRLARSRSTIAGVNGRTIRNLTGPAKAGINRVMWTLTPDPPQGQGQGGAGGGGRGGGGAAVEPGAYLVTLSVGGKTLTQSQ